MNTATGLREPPGSYGFPVLGVMFDTADFLFFSGWERFFERRRAQYQSTVFKTSLFQKTIVLMDHKAISNLFASTPFIQDYGFSWAVPPFDLVGEVKPSIFETGPRHDAPKALYQRLLALRSAELPRIFDRLLTEYTNKWARLGKFDWRDELESFTVDLVFQWLLGITVETAKVRTIYNNIFTDIFWRITRFFPWSVHSKSLVYYNELLQLIETSEVFESLAKLAQENELGDRSYVAKQLAFLIGMNSYLGLQCLFKSIVGELNERPQVRHQLINSIGTIGTDQIWRAPLPAIDMFVMEVLRLHPPVFFIFGRAQAETTIASSTGDFRIARGELVMGMIPAAHADGNVFTDPSTFDPNRFSVPDQRQHLIWPRGLHDSVVQSNDRTCPGKDAALTIARSFCATLLAKAEWNMTGPVAWDRRWFNLNVAAPKGALPVSFSLISR